MIQNPLQVSGFVSTFPPAISGEGGHKRLYHLTCLLVEKYRLMPDQVWILLLEYNLRCEPMWSKAELIHKMADASKMSGDFWEEADLSQKLDFPEGYTLDSGNEPTRFNHRTSDKSQKPDRTGFGPGADGELEVLAKLRGISIAALRWAQERGVLVFGFWYGQKCWGLTDCSESVLEIRRLDGKPFPAVGSLSERKSHAMRGSCKRRPVGLDEAGTFQNIAVVEGGPDFLAAHDLILREQSTARCAPIAMLCANVAIAPELLPAFKAKHVRIFAHNDASCAGMTGARHWQKQIVKAGALCCELFQFKNFAPIPVKDLNEYLITMDTGRIPSDSKIIPDFQA